MALQKQLLNIPISGGVDTKTDPFQVQAPSASLLENARFQKTGKLSKRFGLVVQPSATLKSGVTGSLTSLTVSKIISDDNQLSVVTNDGIYSYESGDQIFKYENEAGLSPFIRSEYVNPSYYNQVLNDNDITSDGKYRVFVTSQRRETQSNRSLITIEDTSTGQKKSISLASNVATPAIRCVACLNSGQYYFHVFYLSLVGGVSYDILRVVYNQDLTVITSGSVSVGVGNNAQFDICKDNSQFVYLVCKRSASTSTPVAKYEPNGTLVLSATRTGTAATGGANSGYGVSCVILGTNLHVAFISNAGTQIITLEAYNTTTLNLSIAAVTDGTATLVRRVGLCVSGSNLFLAYSKDSSSTVGDFYTVSVTVAASYTYGSVANYSRLFLAAQPFVINSKVYCPVYVKDNYNTGYILNCTDFFIVTEFAPLQFKETLLEVLDNSYPRMVSRSSVLNNVAYVSYPRQSVFEFTDVNTTDSTLSVSSSSTKFDFSASSIYGSKNKVGSTIYLSNGQTLSFDKRYPTENNFYMPPIIVVSENTGVANPNIASKTFSYVAIYEYINGVGEVERSALSNITTITTTAGAASIGIFCSLLVASLKVKTSTSSASIVVYRTTNNGTTFYRLQDTTGMINVFANDTVADSVLQTRETIYTTGNVLENSFAPNSRFSFAGGNRVFLGGLEQRDEIAFSNKQSLGECIAFPFENRIRISTGVKVDDSEIIAGGYMDGKVVVFREQSIYFCQGDGPNDLGIGGFSEPTLIQSDVGCTNPKSVLSMPNGLMFKSKKGIYLLNRGLSVEYIGAPVEDYNSENIVSSLISDKFNECRFYTDQGNCLVYNYLFGTWSVFKNQTSIDADTWEGSPVSILSNKIFKETENTYLDNGATGFYSMKYKSPWLKLDQIQGYFRVYRLWIIGTNKSAHTLKCKIYTDYDDTVSDDYDLILDISDQPQYQFNIHLPNQKCEAIKFEIYDTDHTAATSGEAYDLSNIQLEIGFKAGGFKLATSKTY